MSTPQILLKYQSDEIKFMIYERANSERWYYNSKATCTEHHCKFIKQTLLSLKEQIGPDSIIEGDFKISVSSIDRTFRHKLVVGDKVESESIGWGWMDQSKLHPQWAYI
jgi:hypothetical protein